MMIPLDLFSRIETTNQLLLVEPYLFFVEISIEVCRPQDVVSSDLESVVLRDAVMSRAQLPRFWRP